MNIENNTKYIQILEKYRNQLPFKVDEIENCWNHLKSHAWEEKSWDTLYSLVHTLNGSSGTYGFIELSKMLRDLEIYIKPFLQKGPDLNELELINLMILNLKSTINSNNSKSDKTNE